MARILLYMGPPVGSRALIVAAGASCQCEAASSNDLTHHSLTCGLLFDTARIAPNDKPLKQTNESAKQKPYIDLNMAGQMGSLLDDVPLI